MRCGRPRKKAGAMSRWAREHPVPARSRLIYPVSISLTCSLSLATAPLPPLPLFLPFLARSRSLALSLPLARRLLPPVEESTPPP